MSSNASRVYRYACRTCGRRYEYTAAEDPGSQTCTCTARTANAWWNAGPVDAFAKPDTAGMVFGPYETDKWEREQAALRGVYDLELDPERLTIRDEDPAEAPAVQLGLFAS